MNSRKSEIRKGCKNRISELSDEQKSQAYSDFAKNIKTLFTNILNEKSLIGVYAPLPDEIDWEEALSETSFQTAYPGYEKDKMSFYLCSKDELEETTEFGVKLLTPPKKKLVEPDLVLVPGMAFNSIGHRLGRGKGFYDSFLVNFSGISVGVCFDTQILESLPMEDHDVPVKYVVSDKRVFECS